MVTKNPNAIKKLYAGARNQSHTPELAVSTSEFYICLHITCLHVYIHTYIEAKTVSLKLGNTSIVIHLLYIHDFYFTIKYCISLSLDSMDALCINYEYLAVALLSWSYPVTHGKDEK